MSLPRPTGAAAVSYCGRRTSPVQLRDECYTIRRFIKARNDNQSGNPPSPRPSNEDRDVQHQQHQQAAAEPPALAESGQAGRRLPAGAQMRPMRNSRASAIKQAGYDAVWRGQTTWNGVAILLAASKPVVDAHAAARRCRRHAERAISRRLSTAFSSAASICRTAIRSRARSSTTSSPGSSGLSRTRATLLERTCRSCWRATTTSCRPTSTSTRPSHGTTTRCCSRKAARAYARARQAGLDRCASRAASGRARSIRSGTTCAIAGSAMPGCGSIICCSAHRSQNASVGRRRSRGAEPPGASDHAPTWIVLKT